MNVKCQRCGKEWDYQGEKIKLMKKFSYPQYVACPRCHTSVKLKEQGKDVSLL